jgi:hypothetical protein
VNQPKFKPGVSRIRIRSVNHNVPYLPVKNTSTIWLSLSKRPKYRPVLCASTLNVFRETPTAHEGRCERLWRVWPSHVARRRTDGWYANIEFQRLLGIICSKRILSRLQCWRKHILTGREALIFNSNFLLHVITDGADTPASQHKCRGKGRFLATRVEVLHTPHTDSQISWYERRHYQDEFPCCEHGLWQTIWTSSGTFREANIIYLIADSWGGKIGAMSSLFSPNTSQVILLTHYVTVRT